MLASTTKYSSQTVFFLATVYVSKYELEYSGWGPRRKVLVSRPLWLPQTFVHFCPDFRAFTRFLCIHGHFFVSWPAFCAFTRLSCVYVYTFLSSPDFLALMSRLSCVHVQTFVLYPDFRAFSQFFCVRVQIFVRATKFFALIQLLSVQIPDTKKMFFARLFFKNVKKIVGSMRFCRWYKKFDNKDGSF